MTCELSHLKALLVAMFLGHNSTTPLTAGHLRRSPNTKLNSRGAKERSRGPRVDAGIEVEVRAVLIGTSKTALRTQRVAAGRAKIGDLDDDAVAGVAHSVA